MVHNNTPNVYQAGQAIQFSAALGNFLFWFGLATLAIPFVMTEASIAKNEADIKKLKEHVKGIDRKLGISDELSAQAATKNDKTESA